MTPPTPPRFSCGVTLPADERRQPSSAEMPSSGSTETLLVGMKDSVIGRLFSDFSPSPISAMESSLLAILFYLSMLYSPNMYLETKVLLPMASPLIKLSNHAGF